jgi:hypothetical protein
VSVYLSMLDDASGADDRKIILAQCIVQAEILSCRRQGNQSRLLRRTQDGFAWHGPPFVKRPQNPCRHPTISCHRLVAGKPAGLNGLRPPNQPLFQQNLPHPDIRADDFSCVSESGARINKPGKTAEPALKIPSAFQNPLAQTPDRHWYTHP